MANSLRVKITNLLTPESVGRNLVNINKKLDEISSDLRESEKQKDQNKTLFQIVVQWAARLQELIFISALLAKKELKELLANERIHPEKKRAILEEAYANLAEKRIYEEIEKLLEKLHVLIIQTQAQIQELLKPALESTQTQLNSAMQTATQNINTKLSSPNPMDPRPNARFILSLNFVTSLLNQTTARLIHHPQLQGVARPYDPNADVKTQLSQYETRMKALVEENKEEIIKMIAAQLVAERHVVDNPELAYAYAKEIYAALAPHIVTALMLGHLTRLTHQAEELVNDLSEKLHTLAPLSGPTMVHARTVGLAPVASSAIPETQAGAEPAPPGGAAAAAPAAGGDDLSEPSADQPGQEGPGM